MLSVALLGTLVVLQQPSVQLSFKANGLSSTATPIPNYSVELEATNMQKLGLTVPLQGALSLGGKTYRIVSDEPKRVPSRLVLDRDGDGNLNEERVLNWTAETKDGWTRYVCSLDVQLAAGQIGRLNLIRIPVPGSQRISVQPDFGFIGTLKTAGKSFPISFAGAAQADTPIWIDINGDRQKQSRPEVHKVLRPFNVGGKSLEFVLQGGGIRIRPSKVQVAAIPFPPKLVAGTVLPKISLPTLAGTEVSVPGSLTGKLVLVDFWATWCPPCVAEIPNLVAAHREFKDQGLEIVSVSVDSADARKLVDSFVSKNQMTWPQVFDGKGLTGEFVQSLGIEFVPVVLLLDGSTGKILAADEQLKGAKLQATLKAQFAGRKAAR